MAIQFRSLSESAKTMDDILRFSLVREGVDEVKFRKLSESDKKQISNEMISKLYDTIRNKANQVDYSGIEESKGDITRIKGFEELQNAVNFLSSMHSKEKNAPSEITSLVDGLANIKKLKHDFETGFRQNNELIVLVYNNMVVSLVKASSFLVATTVDYVKDPLGGYSTKFKSNHGKDIEINLYFSNISKFNGYVSKGQFSSFIDASLENNNIVGAAGVGIALVSAIASIGVFVWLLREIVYMYFWARTSISDNLKLLGEFVKLNSATLGTDFRSAKEKQEKVAKTLSDLSDKVAVEQKISTKKAVNEIQKENDGTNLTTATANDNFL